MSDYDKQGGGKGKIKWHPDGSVSIKREGDPWEVIDPADLDPVQEVENKEASMKYQIYLPMAKEIVDSIRLYNLENHAGKAHMEHYVARILAEAVEKFPEPKSGTPCTKCGRWIEERSTMAWNTKKGIGYCHDCWLEEYQERRENEAAGSDMAQYDAYKKGEIRGKEKPKPESGATGETDLSADKAYAKRGVSRDQPQADQGGLPPDRGPDYSPGGDDLPGTGSPPKDGSAGDGGGSGVKAPSPGLPTTSTFRKNSNDSGPNPLSSIMAVLSGRGAELALCGHPGSDRNGHKKGHCEARFEDSCGWSADRDLL